MAAFFVVSPPSSRLTPTVFANTVKFDPPVGESLAVSTTLSSGLSIQVEVSMLRMKVDTRVLDWATAARCLNDLERALKGELLAELRYFQALDEPLAA